MNLNKITKSLPFKIFRLLFSFLIASLFVLIVFCMFLPTDPATETIPEKYDKWIPILGALLAFIVNFIIEYNSVTRLKYDILKAEAEIKSALERRDSLLEKATKVSDKYSVIEQDVFLEFADARKSSGAHSSARIRTSKDFKAVVESYPELKANEHVHKLLAQIEGSENILYNAKNAYAAKAADFNTRIHTFPNALYRRLFKWEDFSAESVIFSESENEITDEQLGI